MPSGSRCRIFFAFPFERKNWRSESGEKAKDAHAAVDATRRSQMRRGEGGREFRHFSKEKPDRRDVARPRQNVAASRRSRRRHRRRCEKSQISRMWAPTRTGRPAGSRPSYTAEPKVSAAPYLGAEMELRTRRRETSTRLRDKAFVQIFTYLPG